MMDTNVDGQVQRIQAMLFAKAGGEPETKFTRLYKYLKKPYWVETAVELVKRNKGSRTPGIDGMTRADIQDEKQWRKFVETIWDEIYTETYQPSPSRRTHICKANGKKRPLGIATLKDRVVQQMLKMLIEPIFEADFLPCSYGFRPYRSTWDALAEVHHFLKQPCMYYTIIEGDIKDCFGTVDHSQLMRNIQERIQDRRLLELIWKMLKAGVMENLEYFKTEMGTPQGSIVSPLLANIYLHSLDSWLHHRFHSIGRDGRQKLARTGKLAFVRYIRFADDFVVMLRGSREQAQALKQGLTEYIRDQLKMELSDEKTLISEATDGFDFLGVHIKVSARWSDKNRVLPYRTPAKKSIVNYKRKVQELTGRNLDYVPPAERIRSLNWLANGWANYHRWGNAKKAFGKLGWWTNCQAFKMLQRCMSDKGQRDVYEEHIRPIRECNNLKKWQAQHGQRLTVTVTVETDYRLGLLPMDVISTARYWEYRGNRIPQPFQLIGQNETGIQRDAEFYTADEAVTFTQLDAVYIEAYPIQYFLKREEVFY